MFRTNFRIPAALVFALAAAAHADVVCIKSTGKTRSMKVRAGDACSASESALGNFGVLQAMFAAGATTTTGGTLHLDNVQLANVQIVSPIDSPAAAVAAEALTVGETLRYCTGGGYPGEVGTQFACTSSDDCNHVCVAGENTVLGKAGGYTCDTNGQCNTMLKSDGVCALAATCSEYAVLSVVGSDVYFSGFNVHVRNGQGTTETTNGRGNLIMGYNEDLGLPLGSRTGSHNVVVGSEHAYTNYGGLVAGFGNRISGEFASVTGGTGNTASRYYASVSGGALNTASGGAASVSGGYRNTASGSQASVSGGATNSAGGSNASVSGGVLNLATGPQASVSGGSQNNAAEAGASVSGGSENQALASNAAVSGGLRNTASGQNASVSGGLNNVGFGNEASVSGGASNSANKDATSVSGGSNNIADDLWASVSGGDGNAANGPNASVSGGLNNVASGGAASVSGGYYNVAYNGLSSVSGGAANHATGLYSSVSGGSSNTAGGPSTSVSGGAYNNANGDASSVSGGSNNVAAGTESVVSGGFSLTEPGFTGWRAGSEGPVAGPYTLFSR